MFLFLGCQHSNEPSQEASANSTTLRHWKLVCLGGSTTIGTGLSPEQAYPAQLAGLLQTSGQAVKVVNAGIQGETVTGAASRVAWILQQRIDAMLLALGEEPTEAQLSMEQKKANWQQLLSTIRAAYPELPVYILSMERTDTDQATPLWDKLKATYQVRVLEPNWAQIAPGASEALDEEAQRSLAKWLAQQLHELPEQYYQQSAR